MKRYIAIDILACKQNNLSINEWILLENIHFLSNNEYRACFASKETLRKYLNISNGQIYKIISNLVKLGYITKTELGHLRVTQKWIGIVSPKNGDTIQNLEDISPKNGDEPLQKMETKRENSKRDIKSLSKKRFKTIFEFKNYCIKNLNLKEFTLKKDNPCNFLETTKLQFKNGYIFNIFTDKFLEKEDAMQIWNYLFKQQKGFLKENE